MPTKTQVLVIPMFRRVWLQHVCTGGASRGPPPPPWQSGATLQDKARLAVAGLREWGAAKIDKQWHAIQTAPEGSMNSYLFKLAQFVLRRVDPDESFLKGLPQGTNSLEFLLPASVPPRLARRRLRLLCRARAPQHEKRMYLWAAAILPQMPLVVLPLPNIPIYYSAWRAWSHRSAAAGARGLLAALDAASDVQRYELASSLQALQARGFDLRPGEWPAQMAADIDRLREAADAARARGALASRSIGAAGGPTPAGEAAAAPPGASDRSGSGSGAISSTSSSSGGGGGASSSSSAAAQAAAGGSAAEQEHHNQQQQEQQRQQVEEQRPSVLPVPVFTPDDFLEEVVDPKARWTAPLTEAAAERLMAHWRQDHLLEHFRAAEWRCLPQDAQRRRE